MRILTVTDRNDTLIKNLIELWEKSVKTTHLFLSPEEVSEIKKYVPIAMKNVEHLLIAADRNDLPVGFMGIENQKLEMLFIHPDYIGRGIGRQLILYGIETYGVNEVTVNQQNPAAVGFYEHMGFKTYKRTALDEAGMPYPLFYMKLN